VLVISIEKHLTKPWLELYIILLFKKKHIHEWFLGYMNFVLKVWCQVQYDIYLWEKILDYSQRSHVIQKPAKFPFINRFFLKLDNISVKYFRNRFWQNITFLYTWILSFTILKSLTNNLVSSLGWESFNGQDSWIILTKENQINSNNRTLYLI